MRRSVLVTAGAVAAAAAIGGGVIAVAGLPRELPIDPAELGRSMSSAPVPADRYYSRGILPLEVDEELGALEVYTVQPDGTLHPPPQGLRMDIWSLMTRIMTPAGAGDALRTYKVGDQPDSDRTAWVVAHGQREDEWILGVNLATSEDPTELAATLIHEYAHLIAFREGQVVPAAGSCTTVLLPEGCALPGGYLDAFHSAFWVGYGDAAPGPANADPEAAARLRAARPGAFVSEYAAMNLVEDFAESFTAYLHVGGDVPQSAFEGKLAFFDHYEETAQIRERVRAELEGTLGTLRID